MSLLRTLVVSLSAGAMAAVLLAGVKIALDNPIAAIKWIATCATLSAIIIVSFWFAWKVEDAIRRWEARREPPCPACGGRGYLDVYTSNPRKVVTTTTTCDRCKGTGKRS